MLIRMINRISKKAICSYKGEQYRIPEKDDHVVLNEKEYVVVGRLFDLSSKEIDVFVRPATGNDYLYLEVK